MSETQPAENGADKNVVKTIVLDVNQGGACVQGVFHVELPPGSEGDDGVLEAAVREQHFGPANPIVPMDRDAAIRLIRDLRAAVQFLDEMDQEEGTPPSEERPDPVGDALDAFGDLLGTVDQWGDACMFGDGHKSKVAYGECSDPACPSVEYRGLLDEAREAHAAKREEIDVWDDGAFEGHRADELLLGVDSSRDLRLVAVLEDGERVPLQVPNKFLRGDLGLAGFIRENCLQ